ncbi:HAD-like domain-containing protein [Artemisia annua]|uniref:HAD-like domain-containing protein n=1 Tax=Artemisia annua TaxID=35608 RepID=A0A2U1QIV4_ARTAN|nr:HAD-like domain-containing protein [Artemisia annua]
MVKEGFEDWLLFIQDMVVKSRKIKVHTTNGIIVDQAWKELRVGDVIKGDGNPRLGVVGGFSLTNHIVPCGRRILEDSEDKTDFEWLDSSGLGVGGGVHRWLPSHDSEKMHRLPLPLWREEENYFLLRKMKSTTHPTIREIFQ